MSRAQEIIEMLDYIDEKDPHHFVKATKDFLDQSQKEGASRGLAKHAWAKGHEIGGRVQHLIDTGGAHNAAALGASAAGAAGLGAIGATLASKRHARKKREAQQGNNK
jgi:hypothetical protein